MDILCFVKKFDPAPRSTSFWRIFEERILPFYHHFYKLADPLSRPSKRLNPLFLLRLGLYHSQSPSLIDAF
jgi:hypothetical protein